MSFANRPHLTDRIKPLSPAKPKTIPWVGNGTQYKMHKQQMRGPRSHDNPLFLDSSVDDDRRRDSRNVEELMLSSRSFSGHKVNERFQKHGRIKGSERSPLSQASKGSISCLASAPIQASPKKILCEKNGNYSVSRVEESKARCRRIELFKAASDSSHSTLEFEGENMPRNFSTQLPTPISVGLLQFHPSSALVYSSSESQPTIAARKDELSPRSPIPKASFPCSAFLSADSNFPRSEEGAEDLKPQNFRDRPKWQLDRIHIPISRVDSEDMDSADTSHLQTYERVTESPSSGTTPTSAFSSLPVSLEFHQSESKHGTSSSAMIEADKSLLLEKTAEKSEDEERATVSVNLKLLKVGEAGASVDEDDEEFEVSKRGSILRGVIFTVWLMGLAGFILLAQNSPGILPTMVHDKLLPSWQWTDIKFQASTVKLVKGCEGLWLTESNPAQMAVDINQLQRNVKTLKERFDITLRSISIRFSSYNQWSTWHFFKGNMDDWKIGVSLWTKPLQNMAQKVFVENQGKEDSLSSEAGKWDWFSEYDVFLEKHIFNTLPENEKEVIQKTLFSTNSPKSKALLFAINDEEKAGKSETFRMEEEESVFFPEVTSVQALQEVVNDRSSSIQQKEFSSLTEIHSVERPIPIKEKNVQASSDISLPQDISIDNKQGNECEGSQQGVQTSQMKALRGQGSSDFVTEDQENEKNTIASDDISFTSTNSKSNGVLRNGYWWWLFLFLLPLIIGLPILSMHLKLVNLHEVRMDLPGAREAFIKLLKPNTVRGGTKREFDGDYTPETGDSNNKEEFIMRPETFEDSPLGSFTVYKRVVSQKGSGNEQIKLTPVRRSNRIRHQSFSPSNRALKSPEF